MCLVESFGGGVKLKTKIRGQSWREPVSRCRDVKAFVLGPVSLDLGDSVPAESLRLPHLLLLVFI